MHERRAELDDLRLRALEIQAQAGLALGGATADAAERAALEITRDAPLREAGHRLLMEALAARGEVAEALAAYERLRVLLRDELGMTPGEAVRALHARLLTGEPARPILPAPPSRRRSGSPTGSRSRWARRGSAATPRCGGSASGPTGPRPARPSSCS